MFMVVLDHMRGLVILINDILHIYTLKRPCIPHEWYLSPCSGMSVFIIGVMLMNKDLNSSLVVVSGKWKFRSSKPKSPPKVSRVHGSMSEFFFVHCSIF